MSHSAVPAVLSLLLFSFLPLQKENPPDPVVIEGTTMGTSYRIVYFDEPQRRNFKSSIDSLLVTVNKAISTYDPESEVSRFNKSEAGISLTLPYMPDILRTAKRIFRASGGAFDPTVMPLVEAWGFGPRKSTTPSPSDIDSLRQFVGFGNVRFTRQGLKKSHSGVQLDFGGIGQGYGADIVTKFLHRRGIQNILVELGGEGIACGENLKKRQPWRIGILDPNSTQDHQFFKAYVTLRNKAFTTSGNYFNYRVIGSRKFGHTIDPRSGYPVQHSLLSASVFADDCTTADAWATAFMVMGIEKAIAKVQTLRGVDALFIYSSENGALKTYVTRGIDKDIIFE